MTEPSAPPLRPRAALARNAIHLSVALLPVLWMAALIETSTVRALVAAATVVALLVEVARWRLPAVQRRFVDLFGPLLKAQEQRRLTGATWFAIAICIAVFLLPPVPARVALWAGATGDAAAAIVGGWWQRRRGSQASQKSLVGSAACLALAALGASWLGTATLLLALAIGAATAIAEWPDRFGDDNLRVTLVAGVTAWGLLI